MTAHLLFMSPAKANRAKCRPAHREGEVKALAVDPAESAEAGFAIFVAVVHDHGGGQEVELPSVRQRRAMLGDVGGVFRGVELDFHAFLVDAGNRPVNNNMHMQSII
jgi:hypothetical protein